MQVLLIYDLSSNLRPLQYFSGVGVCVKHTFWQDFGIKARDNFFANIVPKTMNVKR